MSVAAVAQRRRRHWVRWLLGLVVLALLIWVSSICFWIVRESWQQEVHPADAIIVFGAAEYDGRPSPVFRARLDHAYDLYRRGVSPFVITTGGAGGDPKYTEGAVGRDYLAQRGIPSDHLIAETQASDTAESVDRLAVIMHANHMRSCIAVSDEYHVFRIRKLLERKGVRVFVAPRPESHPLTPWQRIVAVLREAASYMVWRTHLPL